MLEPVPVTVLQFGAGRFLRAFVDLFVHEANQTAHPTGSVLVVQSTGIERAAALNAQQGRYHVAVRGLREGGPIDQLIEVASVQRAFAASAAWSGVLEASRAPSLRAIVSNVTEAGYALDANDSPDDNPPRSFAAKLIQALDDRFQAGERGITVLPCELLDRTAERLRSLVLEQAKRWRCGVRFVEWLQEACSWRNTLVDRIVSSPAPGDAIARRDPLFAVTEPFASWMIEGIAEPPILAGHPDVQAVERLDPYHLRKVRILNGAHTALVAKALPLGLETVRAAMLDPRISRWLWSLLFEEVVPTLEGRTLDAARFAEQVLERFANPFLEHRLAEIALHHDVKVQSRIVPTIDEYRQRFGHSPRLLSELV